VVLLDVDVQSLSDAANYHEFCRLLARLKSNYQLGELVKVDNYPEVIKLIAEFTVTSLQVFVSPVLLHAHYLTKGGSSLVSVWLESHAVQHSDGR